MTKFRSVVAAPCALLVVLASCANYAKRADADYARGDWEAAVADYERAIAAESDPAEIERLKLRLADSRQHAYEQCLAAAKARAGIGDDTAALQLAERAFHYSPTAEVQTLVRELRGREGERLLRLGAEALRAEHWEEAVADLEQAQQFAPSDEGSRLLATARSGLEHYHRRQFEQLCGEGESALHERQWAIAASKFESANQHGQTQQSKDHGNFARAMADGETMFAKRPCDPASVQKTVACYEEALRYGCDQDFVRQRLHAVELRSYRVTINHAVVLPFRPSTLVAWDGDTHPLRGADVFLRKLGALASNAKEPRVYVDVMKLLITGHAAPDCYLDFALGKEHFDNRDFAREDDCEPTWNLPLPVLTTNAFDDRVLAIRVVDRDDKTDETIGCHQVRIGDLVRECGMHTFRLFDDHGDLHADGLLEITLTVEPADQTAPTPTRATH